MMNSTFTNLTAFGFLDNSFTTLIKSILAVPFSLVFSLNCYIIFLVLFKARGMDVSVVFALNTAAAEILYSTLSLLHAVLMETFDYFVFELLMFLFGTSMSARLLFPCCVCLERYLAVVHPVTFLRFKLLKYRIACSVSAWICALGLGISICTLSVPFTVLAVVYLSILAVDFFCCVSILKKLKHPVPGNTEHGQSEMNAVKKKAFKIVCINLLTSLLQNFPIALSFLLEDLLSEHDAYLAVNICLAVNVCLGFVQPVLILHKAGKLSFIKCS